MSPDTSITIFGIPFNILLAIFCTLLAISIAGISISLYKLFSDKEKDNGMDDKS